MKSIDKLAWIELQNKSILSTKVLEKQIYIPVAKEKKGQETKKLNKRNSRRANSTTVKQLAVHGCFC
jgi:hypothetical protein